MVSYHQVILYIQFCIYFILCVLFHTKACVNIVSSEAYPCQNFNISLVVLTSCLHKVVNILLQNDALLLTRSFTPGGHSKSFSLYRKAVSTLILKNHLLFTHLQFWDIRLLDVFCHTFCFVTSLNSFLMALFHSLHDSMSGWCQASLKFFSSSFCSLFILSHHGSSR